LVGDVLKRKGVKKKVGEKVVGGAILKKCAKHHLRKKITKNG